MKKKIEPKKVVKKVVKPESKKIVVKKAVEKPEPVSVPETVVPELARVQSHQVVKS